MAAVLLLPYTAPSVCGVLGRMGSAMELSANAGDSTVRAPESSDMCCTLNECGIPQVAPSLAFLTSSVSTHGASCVV